MAEDRQGELVRPKGGVARVPLPNVRSAVLLDVGHLRDVVAGLLGHFVEFRVGCVAGLVVSHRHSGWLSGMVDAEEEDDRKEGTVASYITQL